MGRYPEARPSARSHQHERQRLEDRGLAVSVLSDQHRPWRLVVLGAERQVEALDAAEVADGELVDDQRAFILEFGAAPARVVHPVSDGGDYAGKTALRGRRLSE